MGWIRTEEGTLLLKEGGDALGAAAGGQGVCVRWQVCVFIRRGIGRRRGAGDAADDYAVSVDGFCWGIRR